MNVWIKHCSFIFILFFLSMGMSWIILPIQLWVSHFPWMEILLIQPWVSHFP